MAMFLPRLLPINLSFLVFVLIFKSWKRAADQGSHKSLIKVISWCSYNYTEETLSI